MKCEERTLLENSTGESNKIAFDRDPYNGNYCPQYGFIFDDIQPGDYAEISPGLDTDDLYADRRTLVSIKADKLRYAGKTFRVLRKSSDEVILEGPYGAEESWPHGCFRAIYKAKNRSPEMAGKILLRRKGKGKRRLSATGSNITVNERIH